MLALANHAVALEAIYKCESKRFVDNIIVQVIERHIVDGLEDILTAADSNGLASITDEDCAEMVEESANITTQREYLQALKAKLENGQEVLRKSLRRARKV